jgi:poly-gamma-glutamate synthase PgsB/CapB
LIILAISLMSFLAYLILESIILNRQIHAIPQRICVTGIRGKSSVTRLLASVLRESGRTVVAKTTGSQARYIVPNSEERDISRRGMPSIIEQEKVLNLATQFNADCIVAEIMSIHPENHYIESQRLLKPNIVIITNVREDHVEAMGKTKDEIASVLCLDIPHKSTVFIPEKENRPIFQTAVKSAQGKIILAAEGISSALQQDHPDIRREEFPEDIDLVYTVGKHLNIRERVIAKGICQAKHDVGTFNIWEYRPDGGEKTVYLVNAFAANDPESTFSAIARLKGILPLASIELIGLLSLRSDRGDRTVQWIQALKTSEFNLFSKLYVTGAHAEIVKRRLKNVSVIKSKLPEEIMKIIMVDAKGGCLIFGFGNIVGIGLSLVEYWNDVGEEYGI